MTSQVPRSTDGRAFTDQLLTAAGAHLEAALQSIGEDDHAQFAASAGIAAELLTKAVLCDVHPALVAERDFHSLLNLLGLSSYSTTRGAAIRTITAKEALDRCGALFPALKDLERPVRELSELRNAAVHAGSVPAGIGAKAISGLHEVVLACCATLSILPDDLAPGYAEVLRLVPKTDSITFRVACRIASHRASFDRLARRIPQLLDVPPPAITNKIAEVGCPACAAMLPVASSRLKSVLDGERMYELRATDLAAFGCWRCGLELTDLAELKAAAIAIEHERREFIGTLLLCQDCNSEFVFDRSSELFFAERGFSRPRRCKACARARKAERSQKGDERPMFDVTCTNCGEQTQVPFIPRLDEVTGAPIHPVLCRNCFAGRHL